MKKSYIFSLVIVFLLNATLSLAADESNKPANYLAIKGGIYSPTNSFDLGQAVGTSTTRKLDSKIGFDGEVAFGHYFVPMFAMEVSGGYFESEGSAEATTGLSDAKIRVIPALVTAKLLLPLGPIEPYGEFGAGAYFSKLLQDAPEHDRSTKTIFGLHAGAGINFNVTDAFFLGFEGRYLWTENSWGTADVKLDGFTATGNIGFRY